MSTSERSLVPDWEERIDRHADPRVAEILRRRAERVAEAKIAKLQNGSASENLTAVELDAAINPRARPKEENEPPVRTIAKEKSPPSEPRCTRLVARRQKIEACLRLHYDWSDRRISDAETVSRELVLKVRKGLIDRSQIPDSTRRLGADDKMYKIDGRPRAMRSDIASTATKACVKALSRLNQEDRAVVLDCLGRRFRITTLENT